MKATLSDTLKLAYVAEGPRTEFTETIGEFATKSEARRTRSTRLRRRLKFSFGGVALAASLTAGLVLEPRIALAVLLHKVHGRLDDQGSVHYKLWTIGADGSRTISQEIWHERGADRIERGSGSEVIFERGSSRWVYDVAAKSVIAYYDDPKAWRPGSFKGADLLNELDKSGWLDKVNSEVVGEQFVTSVVGKSERTRIRLWIDRGSDLPTKVEIQAPRGSGWTTVQEGEFDFSDHGKLVGNLAELPKGVPVINAQDAKERWQAKWSKPLSTYRSTRIYDVQMNERGDVFVIYSGGNIRLECDGTAYTSQVGTDEFHPVMHTLNSDRVDGFTSPNGDLRGKVFTPIEPHAWKPVSLRVISVNPSSERFGPEEGHRFEKDGKEYFSWSSAEMARAIERHERSAADLGKRTLRLQVTAPTCVSLPSYMPLMPLAIQSETALNELEATARATYFEGEQRWPDAEREIRAEIRYFDLKCLEYGSPGVQPQAYFELYQALSAQGKHVAAIEALKAIPDQMVYKDDDLQRLVDEAFSKEGLR